MRLLKLIRTSLRARFIIGIGVMLLPLVAFIISAFVYFESTFSIFEEVAEETIEEQLPVVRLQTLIREAAMPANDYLINGNPGEEKVFLQLSRNVDKAFEEAKAAPFALKEEKLLIENAYKDWQEAQAISKEILAVPNPLEYQAGKYDMVRLDEQINQAVSKLEELYNLTYPEITVELDSARAIKQKAYLVNLLISVFGIGIAIATAMLLARSVILPVHVLKFGAGQIGNGNLSYRVTVTTPDELGQLAATFNDMAEKLEKSRQELIYLSTHDPLTGLFNRNEFHRRLQEEIEHSKRYGHSIALLIMDVDYFKSVNDTYGHQTGDELLKQVTKIILGQVRVVDHIARYGGEEFIIIVRSSVSGTLKLAERIREAVAAAAFTTESGQEIKTTVSIGIAFMPEDAQTEQHLVSAADKALYEAKSNGRNRVCSFGRVTTPT